MRARLIKPGYFRDVKLLALPPLARLLFAGLWTLADRMGRLDDDPLQIKIDVLPYDDADVHAMLDDLADVGVIRRYQANGHAYIQVVNFVKHQSPNVREPKSIIPAPDEHSTGTTPTVPERYQSGTRAEAEKEDLAREAPAAPAVVMDQPFALWDVLCEESDADEASLPPSFKKKQLGKAKALIAQGYGVVAVRACLRYLKSQDWRTSTVDLFTVEHEIGKWQLAGKPTTAMPARASPNAKPDRTEGTEAGAVTWMRRHGIQAAPS